jgi:hypothetical protein
MDSVILSHEDADIIECLAHAADHFTKAAERTGEPEARSALLKAATASAAKVEAMLTPEPDFRISVDVHVDSAMTEALGSPHSVAKSIRRGIQEGVEL